MIISLNNYRIHCFNIPRIDCLSSLSSTSVDDFNKDKINQFWVLLLSNNIVKRLCLLDNCHQRISDNNNLIRNAINTGINVDD